MTKECFIRFSAPEGTIFRACVKCEMPHIADPNDPKDNICLWCQINPENEKIE